MKIKRDAFLYYDGYQINFAQCGSCWLFNRREERCAVLPSVDEVLRTDSCGYWGAGEYDWNLRSMELPRFKPEEVGFVRRQVRCENCAHFDAERRVCYLYETLNKDQPDLFDLDTKVVPGGCCNAQVPKV